MSRRLAQIALYALSLSILALAMGLPRATPGALVLVALAALLVPRASLRYAVEVLLVVVTAVGLSSAMAAFIAAIMAALALRVQIGRQSSPNRAIVVAILAVAVAAFVHPWAGWAFIPMAGLALWALLSDSDRDPASDRPRLRLTFGLALASLLGAAFLALFLRVVPWQGLLKGLFTLLLYPVKAIFRGFGVIPRHPKNSLSPSKGSRHPLVAKAPAHTALPHALLWSLLIVVALSALVVIIYFGWRYASDGADIVSPAGDPPGVLRESLAEDEMVSAFGRRASRLAPVRHFIRRRHQLALTRRKPDETLREWLKRTKPNLDPEAIRIYEDVRYGDRSDTIEKRRALETLWRQSEDS